MNICEMVTKDFSRNILGVAVKANKYGIILWVTDFKENLIKGYML